jgi:hypothetical protein
MELANLSHNMARAHKKPLLERHHLVPHNMAPVSEIDELKGASSQDGLRADVTPHYVAETIR